MKAPAGSTFDVGLYKGYLDLSRSEFEEGDYMDSDAFAMRAMSAADGSGVGPEELGARKLPEGSVGDLTAARSRLMAAFGQGGKEKAPELAAEAQTSFDCWMQEQEENFQPPHIEACRNAFMLAMDKLEAEVKPKMAMAKEAPKMAAKPMAKPRPPKPVVDGIYIVFFDFDSAELTSDAQAVLAKALADYRVAKPDAISISGHADRAGSGKYNMALSDRRVASVVDALRGGDVPVRILSTSSLGEDKPLVLTKDGAREQRNRRVEIIFE